MLECLRARPGPPSLTLKCFRCGLTRQIEDDGRRVHHAQAHVTACTEAPDDTSAPRLRLVSSNHLEMQLQDGTVWFEIHRE
jgi:hypothetical protein